MKYLLRLDIDIEACDDVEAREQADNILCTFIIHSDIKYDCKLQKIEKNKQPRGLKLIKGGKNGPQ